MSSQHDYVPIVKGKLNNIKALGKLSSDARLLVKPLIEIMPVDHSKQTVDEHIYKFANYIVKHFPLGRVFVDFHGLRPGETTQDGRDATLAGFALLKNLGRDLTPVYGFERNHDLWPQFKKIISTFKQGFCFRVSIDDLDDRSEETWAQIIEQSAVLGLTPSDTDILVDLRYVGDLSEHYLKELVVDFLSWNPEASSYRSLIVGGSSALKTVSDIQKDSIGEVVRTELKLWSALSQDLDDSFQLLFGDYGVVHPDFSDLGPIRYMNAKIRYNRRKPNFVLSRTRPAVPDKGLRTVLRISSKGLRRSSL